MLGCLRRLFKRDPVPVLIAPVQRVVPEDFDKLKMEIKEVLPSGMSIYSLDLRFDASADGESKMETKLIVHPPRSGGIPFFLTLEFPFEKTRRVMLAAASALNDPQPPKGD